MLCLTCSLDAIALDSMSYQRCQDEMSKEEEEEVI